MKKDFCTLYLIRHGETEWNRERRIQGHSDSPLSAVGVEQARNVSSLFHGVTFSAIYSSDLARAFKTAEIISGTLNVPVVTSHALRERKFGRFEGTRRVDYEHDWKRIHDEHHKLSTKEQWNFVPDDGVESNAELARRFTEELHRIAKGQIGRNILISTHGGCMRTFLMWAKYAPYGALPPRSIGNTGYIVVRSDGESFEIMKVVGVTIEPNNEAVWG